MSGGGGGDSRKSRRQNYSLKESIMKMRKSQQNVFVLLLELDTDARVQ